MLQQTLLHNIVLSTPPKCNIVLSTPPKCNIVLSTPP